MKQHMLTHKIRDMFGSSGGNSGDESRTQTPPQDPNSNSGGGTTGGGSNNAVNNGNNRFSQSYSPAPMDMTDDYTSSGGRKRERSNSSNYDSTTTQFVKQEKDNAIDEHGSNSVHSNASENTSNNNYQEFINKDVDIKNWCQKLKEMPENIAAS